MDEKQAKEAVWAAALSAVAAEKFDEKANDNAHKEYIDAARNMQHWFVPESHSPDEAERLARFLWNLAEPSHALKAPNKT